MQSRLGVLRGTERSHEKAGRPSTSSGQALSTAGETLQLAQGTLLALLLGSEFDDRAVSPTVLGAGESLDLANQSELGRTAIFARAEHAGGGGKLAVFDADLDVGIGAKVLDPVRGVVFGDDVEAAFALGVPDLDLAGLAALAPAGAEVEVLIAVDVTDP